jgi:hypothetical protein
MDPRTTFEAFFDEHRDLGKAEAFRRWCALVEPIVARWDAWRSLERIDFGPAEDFGTLDDDIVIALKSGDENLIARCNAARPDAPSPRG